MIKPFDKSYIDNFRDYTQKRKPDFNNILKILAKQKPSRHTIFDCFIDNAVFEYLTGREVPAGAAEYFKFCIDGFRAAGYDFASVDGSSFSFPKNSEHRDKSLDINEGAIIFNREDFNNYDWQDPEEHDKNSWLPELEEYLPDGMKLLVRGPCGVLENVTALLGYDNMCFMSVDDPELLQDVFDAVGSRLVRFYELLLKYKSVGALISNDDWGFSTQTMLSTADMRKYVIPWHIKIADTIHKGGRPVLLHSCGQLEQVYDDIIDVIKYDGKHSYEDKILPVEQAYEKLNPRIAVLGGIDLDFVCRRTPEEIYDRSCKILEQTASRGGYALGTGNSVPYYVPIENYLAMVAAAIVN